MAEQPILDQLRKLLDDSKQVPVLKKRNRELEAENAELRKRIKETPEDIAQRALKVGAENAKISCKLIQYITKQKSIDNDDEEFKSILKSIQVIKKYILSNE